MSTWGILIKSLGETEADYPLPKRPQAYAFSDPKVHKEALAKAAETRAAKREAVRQQALAYVRKHREVLVDDVARHIGRSTDSTTTLLSSLLINDTLEFSYITSEITHRPKKTVRVKK